MNGIEIERKYLIRMPDEALLCGLEGCERWDIVQIYLCPGPEGETRRVRRVRTGGAERFIYTEKLRISELSSRESEREISAGEYDQMLMQADGQKRPVEKVRYRIPHRGQLLEVDIYSFWSDRATLEIELDSESREPQLPDWIDVIRDVSGDFAYKNSMLAKHVPMEPIA